MTRGLLFLSFSLFLFSLFSSCSGALFYIEHVHLIEQNEQNSGNLLYRGGNPNFENFEYKTLTNEMKRCAEDAGVSFPSSFYMIDINLENPNSSYDAKHIADEDKFFADNKDKGEKIQHTILGETTSPFDYNSSYVQENSKNFDQWSRDDLPAFVENIHALASNSSVSLPSVIYIHCECGCDRTGEVSGSYYMRYMNMTLHDAHLLDKKIADSHT